VVASYQLQIIEFLFLQSQSIKGFVKRNKGALISGFILGVIGSRILYMQDNDGNLVVTSFCIILATCVTFLATAAVKKIRD
jgi:uncharacterized membrane protein YoaK (UPF0700 family)